MKRAGSLWLAAENIFPMQSSYMIDGCRSAQLERFRELAEGGCEAVHVLEIADGNNHINLTLS